MPENINAPNDPRSLKGTQMAIMVDRAGHRPPWHAPIKARMAIKAYASPHTIANGVSNVSTAAHPKLNTRINLPPNCCARIAPGMCIST